MVQSGRDAKARARSAWGAGQRQRGSLEQSYQSPVVPVRAGAPPAEPHLGPFPDAWAIPGDSSALSHSAAHRRWRNARQGDAPHVRSRSGLNDPLRECPTQVRRPGSLIKAEPHLGPEDQLKLPLPFSLGRRVSCLPSREVLPSRLPPLPRLNLLRGSPGCLNDRHILGVKVRQRRARRLLLRTCGTLGDHPLLTPRLATCQALLPRLARVRVTMSLPLRSLALARPPPLLTLAVPLLAHAPWPHPSVLPTRRPALLEPPIPVRRARRHARWHHAVVCEVEVRVARDDHPPRARRVRPSGPGRRPTARLRGGGGRPRAELRPRRERPAAVRVLRPRRGPPTLGGWGGRPARSRLLGGVAGALGSVAPPGASAPLIRPMCPLTVALRRTRVDSRESQREHGRAPRAPWNRTRQGGGGDISHHSYDVWGTIWQ